MGEIADAMLDGVFCAGCGDLFDDVIDDGFEEPGYPRYCAECQHAMRMEERAARKRRPRAKR